MKKSEIGLQLVKVRWSEANDVEREQILLEMKRRGLSITDAILALRNSGVYSLGEAKEYISGSKSWRVEVENGKVLQEIAWQALDNFVSSQGRRPRY